MWMLITFTVMYRVKPPELVKTTQRNGWEVCIDGTKNELFLHLNKLCRNKATNLSMYGH